MYSRKPRETRAPVLCAASSGQTGCPSVPAHLGGISVTNAGVLGLGSCPKRLSVATLTVRYTAIHCQSPQLTSSLLLDWAIYPVSSPIQPVFTEDTTGVAPSRCRGHSAAKCSGSVSKASQSRGGEQRFKLTISVKDIVSIEKVYKRSK